MLSKDIRHFLSWILLFSALILPSLTQGIYIRDSSSRKSEIFSPRDSKTDGSLISTTVNAEGIAGSCHTINWASWDGFSGTKAVGTINNGGDIVQVTMTSNFSFDSTPSIYNYDAKLRNYPDAIPNRTVPRTTWSAGAGGTTTMCFSRKVTNPVLLLASLGASNGTQSKLTFSVPYVVVYDGGNVVYHDSYSLTGTEGYTIIMFPGEFTCVTVNSTTPEYYTNITWGIKPPPFDVQVTTVSSNCKAATMSASGGVSYHWDGGETPDKPTNTFRKSGVYVVTVTDASGCTASASTTITLAPDVEPTITESAKTCGSVTLTASGGKTYLWDGGDDPNSAVNTFHVSGTYTVTVNNEDNCTTTASHTVVLPSPPIALISGNDRGCDNVTLTAEGGIAYHWNGGDTPKEAVNTFRKSGLYTVVVTGPDGCASTVSKAITVTHPLEPTVVISSEPSGPICEGTEVTFTASVENAGDKPILEWYRNDDKVETGFTYKVADLTDTDFITCRLTDTESCASPSTAISNSITKPVSLLPNIILEEHVVLESSSSPIKLNPIIEEAAVGYFWEPAAGLSDPNERAPYANPGTTTTYQLKVVSNSGCEAYAKITVIVKDNLEVPKTFTPNGDGINDTWKIPLLSAFSAAKVKIYNRWGQSVFESLGQYTPWDGTSKGAPVPAGVYYYLINPDKSSRPLSGHVTVVR